MKKIFLLLFLISNIIFAITTFAQRSGEDPTSYVDSIVSAFRGNTNSAVIVGVIKQTPGREMETWKYTYGHLKRDTLTSPPVNDSTLFQIGSITKTFNATLLSMLINNGTISLYDTVQNFLPDSIHVPVYISGNDTSVIRFIDLATHYSGLPDQPPIGSSGMTTYEQMYDYLATYQLTYPPGECYNYSDLGFALLGVALQTILNSSIELLIPQLVCDTLNMYDSKMIGLTTGQLSRRAQGYFEGGGEAPFLMPNWPAYHGAGGLYSTLNDMLKYLKFTMQIDNGVLQNVTDTLFRQRLVSNDSCRMPNSIDSVGLAWQFAKLFPNNPENHIRSVSKDGSTSGFASFICFSKHPVTGVKTGVVIVTNWKNPPPLHTTAFNILKFMNEQGSVGIQNNSQTTGYELAQNYPNPFNPITNLEFEISKPEFVTFKIYDMTGKELMVLLNELKPAGRFAVKFDGINLPSGVYYYRIEAGDFSQTRKMVLAK
jgi:CubicO group peptidase (beta-lactamase class C family)